MKHLSNNDFNNNQLDNVPTPVDPGDAVNKDYIDDISADKVDGSIRLTSSSIQPSDPNDGDLWADASSDAYPLADYLEKSNNLADVPNKAIARANLGVNTGDLMSVAYPLGSVYINAIDPTNPKVLLNMPASTWEPWGVGKAIVGIDTSQTEFDTVNKTGGAKTHTLTEAQLPEVTAEVKKDTGVVYGVPGGGGNASGNPIASTTSTVYSPSVVVKFGGGQAHNNLQPYQVGYVWRRIS